MRFGLVIGVLLHALAFTAVAQEGQGEKKALPRYEKFKRSDVSEVDGLLREARDLKETDPSRALEKAGEALGISLSNRRPSLEAECYIVLGEINDEAQEWRLSLENYTAAYERLHDDFRDSHAFFVALMGISRAHLNLGNFNEAITHYNEALTLSLNPEKAADVRVGISEVYYQQGDYEQALHVLDEVVIGARQGISAAVVAAVQNQKAKIFARRNEAEPARLALESAQENVRANRAAIPSAQEQNTIQAKEEVVDLLHEQKRYDEEIDLRKQSIQYNLESNNFPEVSRDKLGIGKALAAKGETAGAIAELEEAALIADTTGNPREQAGAFLTLAKLYKKNGRPHDALKAYERFSEAVRKYEALAQTRLAARADLLEQQRDIVELSREVAVGLREDAIAQATLARQRLVIYGLVFILVITAVTSYVMYRSAQKSKLANQMLALKSLRSQMNPHFIFNALNSVNQFIALNDERAANKFLADFSKLMRLVLENSQEDFITLDKEKEIIALYLKLEHYRFRDKFDYALTIDDAINGELQMIPPMLIQPYIENAVWHGLRYKEGKGFLSLHLRKHADGIAVEIVDDGIGRKRSADLKTTNQKRQISTGLKNIQERLEIINHVYKTSYRVNISDLDPDTGMGTRVVISIATQNGRQRRHPLKTTASK